MVVINYIIMSSHLWWKPSFSMYTASLHPVISLLRIQLQRTKTLVLGTLLLHEVQALLRCNDVICNEPPWKKKEADCSSEIVSGSSHFNLLLRTLDPILYNMLHNKLNRAKFPKFLLICNLQDQNNKRVIIGTCGWSELDAAHLQACGWRDLAEALLAHSVPYRASIWPTMVRLVADS
jgi:hypothetical protein